MLRFSSLVLLASTARRAGEDRPSPLKNKRNFTLIELLIVIAIIAILAGMLLPALGKARGSALKITCMSNHKSLTTAAMQYCMDNGDSFYDPGSGKFNYIFNISSFVIAPYIGKQPGAAADGIYRRANLNGSNEYFYTSDVLICPGKKLDSNLPTDHYSDNYSWNEQLGSGSSYGNDDYTWPMSKLGSIRRPSQILMFGDGGGNKWGAFNTVTRDGMTFKQFASQVRHGQTVIFSYTDGHTVTVKTNRPFFYKHQYEDFTENRLL